MAGAKKVHVGRSDAAKLEKAYAKFEALCQFEAGDPDEGLRPSEALSGPEPIKNRQLAIVDAANRILKFYGLCVLEMGLSREDVISAIELATLTAYNDPKSGLTTAQIEAARDRAFAMYSKA